MFGIDSSYYFVAPLCENFAKYQFKFYLNFKLAWMHLHLDKYLLPGVKVKDSISSLNLAVYLG